MERSDTAVAPQQAAGRLAGFGFQQVAWPIRRVLSRRRSALILSITALTSPLWNTLRVAGGLMTRFTYSVSKGTSLRWRSDSDDERDCGSKNRYQSQELWLMLLPMTQCSGGPVSHAGSAGSPVLAMLYLQICNPVSYLFNNAELTN